MPASIGGLNKFNAGMTKLLEAASNRKTTLALMAGGFVLERGMKRRIKDYGLIDTSNMINGTTADPDPGSPPDVTIGPKTAYYAQFHEFGTIHLPERSFVRASFDEDKGSAIQEIERVTRKHVLEAAE